MLIQSSIANTTPKNNTNNLNRQHGYVISTKLVKIRCGLKREIQMSPHDSHLDYI